MRGQPVLFEDFHKGVNSAAGPYELEPGEARDARNVVATPRGSIRKRDGLQTFAVPSAECKSLFAGESPDILLAASASIIYKIDSAAAVTQLKTGLSNNPWEWFQGPVSGGQGPFWGMNGSDAPVFYDGAAGATGLWTAASGSLPNGKFVVFHGNRVFVAGVAANPSRLFFSDLNDPRAWPAANVVDFEPNDGDAITGLGTIGPYLLVFKTNKVFVVSDLDRGSNRKLAEGTGCVAHRSIVRTPIGTLFLSRDQGVMLCDGSRVQAISDVIKPMLDAIVPAARAKAAGVFYNNHYYLSIPTSGVANDITLDYDLGLRSWWFHTVPENDWAVWEIAGAPGLYGAKAGQALIDKAFVAGQTQDNGVNYAQAAFGLGSYWAGPYHAFGIPSRRKRVRAVHFDGKGRIQVALAKDFARGAQLGVDSTFATDVSTFGGAGSFGGDGVFGGAADVGEAKLLTPGVARAWSVVFGNNSSDTFEVESYTMWLGKRAD